MSSSDRFRISPGERPKLGERDSGHSEHLPEDEKGERETAKLSQCLEELQELLYANRSASLLICLQALDTGGKDGAIKHVIGAMNPQGCRVESFKQPTPAEASHDFLWRIHAKTPAKGEVVVFNRSHYEDVLAARVHKLVPKSVWKSRYERINEFECELREAGVHVVKFFLHISKKEQLERFRARLEDPAKQWKISESDYSERELWDKYMEAYEDAIERCTTKHAPWYVIPSDHKWFRNLALARILVERLDSLEMRLPKPAVDLDEIRRKYHCLAEQ